MLLVPPPYCLKKPFPTIIKHNLGPKIKSLSFMLLLARTSLFFAHNLLNDHDDEIKRLVNQMVIPLGKK